MRQATRHPLPGAASADIDKPRKVVCALPLWSDDGDQAGESQVCGGAVVTMVQPVNLRDRDDAPGRRCYTGRGAGESLSRLRCVSERM